MRAYQIHNISQIILCIILIGIIQIAYPTIKLIHVSNLSYYESILLNQLPSLLDNVVEWVNAACVVEVTLVVSGI